jgi:CheY-like chemotaxis protein
MEESKVGKMRVLRPVILLLENDSSDVFFFRRALARLGYRGTLRTVTGVSEARSYLEGTGSYTDRDYNPRPDLIVCDMALIGSTGNEFLEWFRVQPAFRDIPVVMLSGSALPSERRRADELGARAFYQKSGDIEELTDRVRSALGYLPRGSA